MALNQRQNPHKYSTVERYVDINLQYVCSLYVLLVSFSVYNITICSKVILCVFLISYLGP